MTQGIDPPAVFKSNNHPSACLLCILNSKHVLLTECAEMLAASAAGRCSAGWLWVQPTAQCPFRVTSKVPCPRTPGHTPPPAPSYFESMESHVIRMSADSCLGGGVVRLDCGKGHPIFKKCSPCDPAQPQNRHTDSRPLSSSTPMPSLKKL